MELLSETQSMIDEKGNPPHPRQKIKARLVRIRDPNEKSSPRSARAHLPTMLRGPRDHRKHENCRCRPPEETRADRVRSLQIEESFRRLWEYPQKDRRHGESEDRAEWIDEGVDGNDQELDQAVWGWFLKGGHGDWEHKDLDVRA